MFNAKQKIAHSIISYDPHMHGTGEVGLQVPIH